MDRSSGLKATAAALGITLTAWAGYKLVIYAKTQYRRRHLVNKYRELLIPSPEQLHLLKLEFIKQLIDGLQHDVETNGRELLQLPTHVTKLPTGHEVGDVYAIDLGGTNFRVMHAKLAQEKSQVESQDVYQVTIPKEVYTGTGQALFDFLATTLKEFIDKHDTAGSLRHGVEPVVGFCFSFPMKQSALDAGVLLDWTKAFACADVIGQDPVVLLSNALKRAGRPCRIVALLNDTVGVFAAHKYVDPSTAIGVIIGTGTNACYVERASQVTKWQPQGTPLAPGTQTAINIEWGAFDSEHLPRCPEDQLVDEATLHQGRYLFEKMLSGMYLGEAARRILMTIAGDTKLFGDFERYPEASAVFARLAKEGSFSTSHLSAICMDDSPLLLHTSHILADPKCLGCKPSLAPHSTRVVVKEVCELVAQRSAHLVAMALDAILTHSQWDGDRDGQATVAFDGGVYEHFEAYQAMLWRALNRIRGPAECAKLRLTLSKGGSCLGAAVLAAAAVAAKPAQAIAAETPPTASLVAAAVTATTSEPIVLAPPSIITAPNANNSGVTTQSKATAKSAAPHVDVAIASIGVSTPSLLAVPVVPEHGSDGIVLPVVEPAAPAAAPKAMTTNVGEQGDDTDAATNGDDEADDVGDGECAKGSTAASPDKPAALGTGTAGGSSKKRKKKKGKK